MNDAAAIGFWKAVRLLFATSRRRFNGRRDRQRALLNSRSGREATNWGPIGTIITLVVMLVLHGVAASAILSAVGAGQRVEIERQGKIVVSNWFYNAARVRDAADWTLDEGGDPLEESRLIAASYPSEESYRREARSIVERDGGDQAVVEQRLRATVTASGSRQLVFRTAAEPGLPALARSGAVATILGSVLLLWWFAMLICQGEGLELDLQRRRHPIWEWLLSHPVGAGPVFFAEMLSPLAANPTYWAAPIFAGILYGALQDPYTGLAAAFLVGIPLTIAAACVGKALEIGAILRLPVRSRGAAIGLMSWFGYASMILVFFSITLVPRIAQAVGHWLGAGAAPWPLLRLFLGLGADGDFSLVRGVLFCWVVSAVVVAAAVVFSARSIRRGLSGAFASDRLPSRSGKKARLGREPLFRKEYLWFVRDRSAVVQALLIPITIAAFQLFNFRFLLTHVSDSWNYLSGAAILFGTYFLWVLGPKSLTSEGSALWLAMTWPRGLESVLKAKAWLWSMIASGLVAAILLAACWFFPQDWWRIALVAIGWCIFARSMAEKSVTLVTTVSESGEAEKIPWGRRWAAQLGMLTFAIGVTTQQWHLAIVGIVYSWITAAAMWENLRARLPYLYDPWSERLPPPPTLMHAMVAISILVECASIFTAVILAIGGRDGLAVAQGVGYAACAIGVWIGVTQFLKMRGVSAARIWRWRDVAPDAETEEAGDSRVRTYLAGDRRELRWLAYGMGGGLLLALFAHLYLGAIALVPWIADEIHASQLQMQSIPGLAAAYAVLAILFAPFAEEYLFRGLLFRTLDRQWGGWKAVAGAAAFFAIYHSPLAWVPVALVGVANCILFKRSKRLAPAVLLHMTYNAVITFWV